MSEDSEVEPGTAPWHAPLAARRVLVFLLGSLGDTVVALPALHLIARRFADAERRVLTHYGVSEKAASMKALLDGSGLIHGYFQFVPRSREFGSMLRLAAEIRRWKPDVVVHLHEPRGMLRSFRDTAFFRLCGIRKMYGVPMRRDLQVSRLVPNTLRYEHRAEYLARSLVDLGDSRLADSKSWSLGLTRAEEAVAQRSLSPLKACNGILAMSIGTKVDVNDWEDTNWTRLLKELGPRLENWGLAILGAPSEFERSEHLRASWSGPSLNFCGRLAVRESAAVLSACTVYVGHDSGPMHLSASVGVPCIGIFSARNLPGRWFPYGEGHTVFYKPPPCFGCQLEVCVQYQKRCLRAITVGEVADAVVTTAAATDRTGAPGDALEMASA